MEKERLLEKAGDPELIAGIYNYCNRWCERCQFTSRCLQYFPNAHKFVRPGFDEY